MITGSRIKAFVERHSIHLISIFKTLVYQGSKKNLLQVDNGIKVPEFFLISTAAHKFTSYLTEGKGLFFMRTKCAHFVLEGFKWLKICSL